MLTFDYRYFGRSESEPRQLVDCYSREEDWRAEVELARSLDRTEAPTCHTLCADR
jgi:hypothetical protein